MQALKGGLFCFNHAPEAGAKRAQARKRGGENSHTPHFADRSMRPHDVKTFDDAQKLLKYIWQEVDGMDNSLERARVLLVVHERLHKSIEIGELEQRIAALEARRK